MDEEDQDIFLAEIFWCHIDEEKSNGQLKIMVDKLLNGESITLEGKELDLSAFLEEYAYSNKGEKCT
jgi:hypothetical protein